MKNIILTDDFGFDNEQKERLQKLGNISYVTDATDSDDWLSKVDDADIICTYGNFLHENIYKLKNTLVTYPYIEIGQFDSKKLESNNVYIANTEGSNKESIAEWVLYMTISLFRNFTPYVRTNNTHKFQSFESLENKKVLIIGAGSIGSRVAELCNNFKMKTTLFKRGDDLYKLSKDQDLIINCLNCNSSTKKLLDEKFFQNLKKDSYYITSSREYTFDLDALIKSLNDGILAGAAIDCDPLPPYDTTNDYYQKILSNDKILVTPHIAFSTKKAAKNGLEIMLKNVEAYCKDEPINILNKS